MSTGPIEFLGEELQEAVGDSTYGGRSGLIQPAIAPDGGVGHDLGGVGSASPVSTASEVAAMMRRVAPTPHTRTPLDQAPYSESDLPVDPATGREILPAWYTDGEGATLSDLKPGGA